MLAFFVFVRTNGNKAFWSCKETTAIIIIILKGEKGHEGAVNPPSPLIVLKHAVPQR